MHKVAILTYDGAALFELGCATELFGLPRPEFESWYECEVVTFAEGPLRTGAGLQLLGKQVQDLSAYSLLVIPSWPTAKAVVADDLGEAVRQFHREGKRILSFCSGAFLLAELGLLNGREASTHWRYAELFQSRFPLVSYVPDVLYIYDGTIGCSAGSSAAIDLGIEVIRGDFGYRVANTVARRMLLSAHRGGGQSQFVETPVPEKTSQFTQALNWALGHLNTRIEVDTLARQASMSRRTFDRKFRANFNITPKTWLTQQRLVLAKQLLEDSTHSIEKVAELSGFENATTMRHHFRKELSVSPSIHRRHFNAAP